jgi:hypothetical protein
MHGSEALFESGNFSSIELAPFAATQSPEHSPLFRLAKNRPRWEGPRANGFSSEESE